MKITFNETVRARSRTYYQILAELSRYTGGQKDGGSILVAGHRGAGKTTMVQNVIDALRQGSNARKPLVIKLQGPDLLRVNGNGSKAAAKNKANPANPAAEGAEPSGPDTPGEASKDDLVIENLLKLLTISLYRALADEFYERYTERVAQSSDVKLREMAGLLRMELDEGPNVSTLRQIWKAGGFLGSGVLGRGQGISEIVLLSTAAQAFKIVSGSLSSSTDNTRRKENKSLQTTKYSFTGKEIINGLVGLLRGGVIGFGVTQAMDGSPFATLVGGVVGIVATLFSTVTVTRVSQRLNTRKESKQYKFIRDTRIATLTRDLPELVRRTMKIGLAPIFIVDELDKSLKAPPYARFGKVIAHLKKLVSEETFFFFLTDRNYYDYISGIYAGSNYPKEYTYFTNRFYITYSSENLHDYLDECLGFERLGTPKERLQAAMFKFLVLNRSNLHIVDVNREIVKWRPRGSEIDIDDPESRDTFRFPVMVQLAIEATLESSDLNDRIDQDRYFFQLLIDAVYYPVRKWHESLDLDTSEAEFKKYIHGRISQQDKTPPSQQADPKDKKKTLDEKLLSEADERALYLKMKEVVGLLTSPENLKSAIRDGKYKTRITKYSGLIGNIIDAIPKSTIADDPKSSPLIRLVSEDKYEWQYDYFGRQRGTNVPDEEEIKQNLAVLETFDNLLKSSLKDVNPSTLEKFGFLPPSPTWAYLSQTARPKLRRYVENKIVYLQLVTDARSLREYLFNVNVRMKAIAKAVQLAARLKSETETWANALEPFGALLDFSDPESIEDAPLFEGIPIFLTGDMWGVDLKSSAIVTTPEISIHRAKARGDWWNMWDKRLREFITDNTGKDQITVEISDIVLYKENFGYARSFGRTISAITKEVWAQILMSAWPDSGLSSAPRDPVRPEDPPGWAVLPALSQLGFGLTGPDLKKVCDKFPSWNGVFYSSPEGPRITGTIFILFGQVPYRDANHYVIPSGDSIDQPQYASLVDIVRHINSDGNIPLLVIGSNYKAPPFITLSADVNEIATSLQEKLGIKLEHTFIFNANPQATRGKFGIVGSLAAAEAILSQPLTAPAGTSGTPVKQ